MSAWNKIILGMAVGVGLNVGLMAGTAQAYLCPIVYDVVRTAWFSTQGINRTMSVWAEYEIIDSKKKELKLWENRRLFKEEKDDKGGEGDPEGENDEAGGEGEGEEGGSEGGSGDLGKAFPKGIYYAYMKDATATGSEAYIPAQSDASAQENYVREALFYDSDVSNLTEKDKQEVLNKRLAYVEALAMEVLSLSAGARDSIAAELNILKDAKTTAGGVIQQVEMMAQTKKVMIEQKAADILLQAKLLELDAAQLILGLNPQRVENPDDEE